MTFPIFRIIITGTIKYNKYGIFIDSFFLFNGENLIDNMAAPYYQLNFAPLAIALC